jgi:hypothetical protein
MLTAVQPPAVRIGVAACEPAGVLGCWRVTWLFYNDGDVGLDLEDAWVPHGRFRGPGHVPLNALVEPWTSMPLEICVAAAEAPGTVIRNAFLIVLVRRGQARWRLFTRMRVEFDERARALPVIENVTHQSVQ